MIEVLQQVMCTHDAEKLAISVLKSMKAVVDQRIT